jgi:hypothetical protein
MRLRARHPAMVAGLGVFALAFAAVFGLEVGGDLVATAVESAGNDYVVFAVFGAIALLLVFVVAASRALFGQDQAELPDPERVQTAPHPGANFDRVVDEGLGLQARFFGDGGDGLTERLRRLAAETVMRERGVSREAAREHVLAGTWTDDRDAAAFLAGPSGPGPSMESRVGAALRGQSWFQHGARAAANEVTRRAGVEAPTTGGVSAETAESAAHEGADETDTTRRKGGGGNAPAPKSIRQAATDGGASGTNGVNSTDGDERDRTADTVGSAWGGDGS